MTFGGLCHKHLKNKSEMYTIIMCNCLHKVKVANMCGSCEVFQVHNCARMYLVGAGLSDLPDGSVPMPLQQVAHLKRDAF